MVGLVGVIARAFGGSLVTVIAASLGMMSFVFDVIIVVSVFF